MGFAKAVTSSQDNKASSPLGITSVVLSALFAIREIQQVRMMLALKLGDFNLWGTLSGARWAYFHDVFNYIDW